MANLSTWAEPICVVRLPGRSLAVFQRWYVVKHRAGAFMAKRPTRWFWTAYWVVILVAISKYSPRGNSYGGRVPNIVARKYFHGVAVLMFAPVMLCDVSAWDPPIYHHLPPLTP